MIITETISWDSVSGADGYNLYARKWDDFGKIYKKINPTLITETSVTPSFADSGFYHGYITTVKNGQESAPSNEVYFHANMGFLEFTSNSFFDPLYYDTNKIDLLVIGAGGAGAVGRPGNNNPGGGAGAGGYKIILGLEVTQVVDIIIGSGGIPGNPSGTGDERAGTNGGDTSFGDIIAFGGGRGGLFSEDPEPIAAGDGGSGGGTTSSGSAVPGTGIEGQGHDGAGATHSTSGLYSGGGGGAKAPGNVGSTTVGSGWGGDGIFLGHIWGFKYGDGGWFCGGGAGGRYNVSNEGQQARGGRGGGGDGGQRGGSPGQDAKPNSGGGGGGGGTDNGANTPSEGGKGADGIALIRWRIIV